MLGWLLHDGFYLIRKLNFTFITQLWETIATASASYATWLQALPPLLSWLGCPVTAVQIAAATSEDVRYRGTDQVREDGPSQMARHRWPVTDGHTWESNQLWQAPACSINKISLVGFDSTAHTNTHKLLSNRPSGVAIRSQRRARRLFWKTHFCDKERFCKQLQKSLDKHAACLKFACRYAYSWFVVGTFHRRSILRPTPSFLIIDAWLPVNREFSVFFFSGSMAGIQRSQRSHFV